MSALVQQRCHHHPAREAVARCPECRRQFCRECIVEHGERVLCATCLQRSQATASRHAWPTAALVRGLMAVVGFAALWVAFFLFGQLLLALPTEFHEGTIWKKQQP